MKHPCTSKHINKISILPNSYFTSLVLFKPPSDISACHAFNKLLRNLCFYCRRCKRLLDSRTLHTCRNFNLRAKFCTLNGFSAHCFAVHNHRRHERVDPSFKIAGKCRVRRFKTSRRKELFAITGTLFILLQCNSLEFFCSISNGCVIYITIKDPFYARRIMLAIYC